MKIGIITMYYGNNNYGGIAQAYALYKYLASEGYDAELISYKRSVQKTVRGAAELKKIGLKGYYKKHSDKFFKRVFSRCEQKLLRKKYDKIIGMEINKRKSAFERSREAIPYSKVYTEETIGECVDDYDVFISGSDQIWSPEAIQPPYVLTFLPPKKKRISYASSITVSSYSDDYCELMKNALSYYDWISVRENDGKVFLENLLHRKVDVTADPTLLLTEAQWNAVTAERQIKDKYLFAYFLGESKEQRKQVKKLAKDKGLKLVTVPHIKGKICSGDLNFADIDLYDIDLSKFLSLIKYSETVCTDSFHAVVFSNIFETDFYVFERQFLSGKTKMNSRLDTLLPLLGEENRRIDGNYSKMIGNSENIDFKNAKKGLTNYVEASKKMLKKALRG